MGGSLSRFTIEIDILVLELTQVDVGTLEGQVAIDAIPGINLVAGVVVVQSGFVGLYAAYASSKI
ncbi:hypothetical protein D3C79_984510 [compost metagenome]